MNLRGVMHGTVSAFALMKAHGSGIIVNTASTAGLLGFPLMAPYAMSNFAIVGLTTALRLEAEQHNIQMNVLCPMAIETPLLESAVSLRLGARWRPNLRTYMTKVGGPPLARSNETSQ